MAPAITGAGQIARLTARDEARHVDFEMVRLRWRRVTSGSKQLKTDMAEGRKLHLMKLGFDPSTAARLSAQHSRNLI